MKNRIALFLFVGLSFFFASCGVNSHVMFKTTGDDIFVEDIPISPKDAYRLAPDDKITLLMYVEGGKRIIDVNSRSEEHTSELQSRPHLVCRLLLEKKK